jgi:hypothetical protein
MELFEQMKGRESSQSEFTKPRKALEEERKYQPKAVEDDL